MDEYVKVSTEVYVKKLIEEGIKPVTAEKFARIKARKGTPGEAVVSWSVDQFGNEIKEKEDVVTIDEKTNEPGWVVTKTDENGEEIIDNNGHKNQWIIKDSVFKRKYEVDPNNIGIYKPTGGKQIFIQIPDNIIVTQWGSEMKVSSGGYINITNPDDMYVIQERDFNDTYRIIDSENIKGHNK